MRHKKLLIFLAVSVFLIAILATTNVFADPPFNEINLKLDTIQQTLDDQVIPQLDTGEVRIPISSLPFTIDEPGSYYLTSDLTSSGDGIIVNADNVTIDLNGFALTGSGSGISSGIHIVQRNNVEIRNGTVKNFMGTYQQGGGVNEWNGQGHRVIGVRAISNGRGIYLGGPNMLVKDCTVGESGYQGIVVGN